MRALVVVLMLCACTAPKGPTSCTVCADACVETLSDSSNCGTCGNACAAGARCENAVCVATCTETTCGDACVDVQTDPLNCGACANACAAANALPACVAGHCTHAPCDEGWSDCDFDATNGCETPGAVCYQDVCGTFPDGGLPDCTFFAANFDATRVLVDSFYDLLAPTDQPDERHYFVVTPKPHAVQRIPLPDIDDGGAFVEGITLSGDGTTVALCVESFTDFSTYLRVIEVSTGVASDFFSDGGSWFPGGGSPLLSYDGRYLLSLGSCDLIGEGDAVVCFGRYDVATGALQLISVDGMSIFAYEMSGDGQIIALLPQVGAVETIDLRDPDAGFRPLVESFDAGESFFASTPSLTLSFDGGVVAFTVVPDDEAGASDIFVVENGTLLPTPWLGPGPFFEPSVTLSNDGRVLAVNSFGSASGACQAFDLDGGAPLELGDPQFAQCFGTLSGDGRSLVTVDQSGNSQGQIRIIRVNRR